MQTDTWWQLRAGQDMWRTKRVLLTDTYSHTAYGAFWPNHEWLSELCFYLLYRLGGLPLLTLFAAALIAAGWALTWRLTRATAREKAFGVGVALISAAGWWEPRPHAFSLLFLPLTVFLIARGRLVWLPPLFLIWANVHGGVLLGFVLAGVGLTARVCYEPRRWRTAALVFGACALAMSVTPMGLTFWTEIPESLMRIRQYTLDEWKRPSLTEAPLAPYWALAAFFTWTLARNLGRVRRLVPGDGAVCACAVLLLAASLSAVRHVGPFLMVGVPAISILLEHRPRRRAVDDEHPVLNLVLISLSILAVIGTLSLAYVNQIPRLKWQPLPSGALAALQQCPDNLYNRYDEGGALLWFAQDRKVFLDGRQDPYPLWLVLEHIAIETGRANHATVFARHDIRCALLPRTSPVAQALPGEKWRTLYRDSTWTVLSK